MLFLVVGTIEECLEALAPKDFMRLRLDAVGNFEPFDWSCILVLHGHGGQISFLNRLLVHEQVSPLLRNLARRLFPLYFRSLPEDAKAAVEGDLRLLSLFLCGPHG